MVGERRKRSLVIALGIIAVSAVFLMVIPSVRSSDTKSNQTGYYLVDILEERKDLPEVKGILFLREQPKRVLRTSTNCG